MATVSASINRKRHRSRSSAVSPRPADRNWPWYFAIKQCKRFNSSLASFHEVPLDVTTWHIADLLNARGIINGDAPTPATKSAQLDKLWASSCKARSFLKANQF